MTNSNRYLMADIAGLELTAEDREILSHPLMGGIILFSRNYHDKQQLEALTTEIKKQADHIVIAVDQEGGRVQRFRDQFVAIPPAAKFGELYSEDPQQAQACAKDCGWLLGAELSLYGADFSFTPVLDLDYGSSSVIGDRAYHADPQTVSLLAGAVIDGLAEAGMAAVGKHFPGHGRVAEDSHEELPVDKRSLAEIEDRDIAPFVNLIEKVQGIMPAHIVYEEIDDKPAGFSSKWIKEILKRKMGFKGVVFSDDLTMKATAAFGSYSDRLVAAMEAGCDAILICNSREGTVEALDSYKYFPDFKGVVSMETMKNRNLTIDKKVISSEKWDRIATKLERLL